MHPIVKIILAICFAGYAVLMVAMARYAWFVLKSVVEFNDAILAGLNKKGYGVEFQLNPKISVVFEEPDCIRPYNVAVISYTPKLGLPSPAINAVEWIHFLQSLRDNNIVVDVRRMGSPNGFF